MTQRESFLSTEKIATARLSFRQLSVLGPEDGDRFFEAFGPGNTVDVIQRPFERFEDYEFLMSAIQRDDPTKYAEIHKGTPFYFMAWTAFDLRNYEKAVYYMDSAIEEDRRARPTSWMDNPGYAFLKFEDSSNQVATRITKHLLENVNRELDRFNALSGRLPITIDLLREGFVDNLMQSPEKHPIVTAFYTFILEAEDRKKEILLRGTGGGSIEPILTFLFKGGLIFETLLKQLYPTQDNGQLCKTLGNVFNTGVFKTDFLNTVDTSSTSLIDIVDVIVNDDMQTAFNVASKLRNTTGHNLVWDDVFSEPENFRKLYEQLINAILYVISVKYL